MKNLLLIFSMLLSSSIYAQIGPDGTGTVNGYYIGPGADLKGADLSSADLSSADLSSADLSGANLTNAVLTNAVLTGADLTGADLGGADLSIASLSNASLTQTIFYGADLRGAVLSGKISDARLEGANLSGVNFENTDLHFLIPRSDYDAVIAERDAKLTLDEVKDLRAGSKMIEISNGEATISMEVEKSNELGSWTVEGNLSTTISVEPGEDKKFFRFKMDDSSSSSDDSSPGGDKGSVGDGISLFDPNGQIRVEIDDDGIELSNP